MGSPSMLPMCLHVGYVVSSAGGVVQIDREIDKKKRWRIDSDVDYR